MWRNCPSAFLVSGVEIRRPGGVLVLGSKRRDAVAEISEVALQEERDDLHYGTVVVTGHEAEYIWLSHPSRSRWLAGPRALVDFLAAR